MRPIRIYFIILLLTMTSLIHAQDSKLKVVSTTSIIADVAQNVGGDLIELVSIVPPDTDVHAFDPVPADIVTVANADVILVNGAGLEVFLNKLLESVTSVEPVVVSNGIEILPFGVQAVDSSAQALGILGEDDFECGLQQADESESAHDTEAEIALGDCDPHVWTSIPNVIIWTNNIAQAFAEADPDNADTYRANADAYIEQLQTVDDEIRNLIDTLPEAGRVLVTNHDFMGYFAHEYGFKIVGTVLPSGTSLAEATPQDIAALLSTIKDYQVKAIFAEISANSQLADVIAQEAGVQVVVDLYSDSLSLPDEPASTYLDYMRYNTQTIVTALGG